MFCQSFTQLNDIGRLSIRVYTPSDMFCQSFTQLNDTGAFEYTCIWGAVLYEIYSLATNASCYCYWRDDKLYYNVTCTRSGTLIYEHTTDHIWLSIPFTLLAQRHNLCACSSINRFSFTPSVLNTAFQALLELYLKMLEWLLSVLCRQKIHGILIPSSKNYTTTGNLTPVFLWHRSISSQTNRFTF